MHVVAVVDAGDDREIAAALSVGADDFLRLAADDEILALRINCLHRRAQRLGELIQIESSLRTREHRFALAADGSNDGLWDWALTEDTIFLSPRCREMLGATDGEIGDEPREWFDRIHPDDMTKFQKALDAHLAGATPTLSCEHRLRSRDGTYRWILARGMADHDSAGRATRVAGFWTDIDAWKESQERLTRGALHDTLTGLPNRAVFIDRLHHALSRAARPNRSRFAVLFLDVDRFKLVNDSLGHGAGDQLLVALAQRLQVLLRQSDTIARFGGDEFAILLEDLEEAKEATAIACRILDEMRSPFELDGHEVFATVSIGVAPGERDYAGPEELLRDADNAMYRAKAAGRDCFSVFSPEMHQHSVSLLQLESDLRRAIEREELVVYYQPIVSLRTGRMTGLEALVRWEHPKRGLLPPAEFVPAAEELGLVIPIDRWVLHQACRQMRAWQVRFHRQPSMTISVNISGLQLTRPDLIMEIDHSLRAHGLYGKILKLEITESVMVEKGRYATEILEQLRLLSIALTIDDFGTGYSSLSYLRRFAVDALKIDVSFVANMLENTDSAEIVDAIVSLALCLRKDIVAEGVENQLQLDHLRQLGCTHAQGHLFSPPLDSDAATALLADDPRW